MSTFIVDCFDDITSEIISKHRMLETIMIRGIKYEFYKSGFPTGTLTLDIYVDSILNTTQDVTFEEINSEIPGTYAHGYVYFELDTPVFVHVDKEIGYHEIELRLRPSGYTFSESTNFGVIKRHNNEIVARYGDDGIQDANAPYSIEIFEII